ncbi:MAG: GntR family transcriptional regulator [Planctomycetota bacterium]|jgi:LacI family transcriptional regulator
MTMNWNTNVEKDSTVPRYLQVKTLLKREILKGNLAGKIPSERTMARQFEVSYLTVRRAIGELVEEGLLYREHGRGTFVPEVGTISRKTQSIGFVFPEGRLGIAHPFFARVFSGLERECRKNNYTFFLTTDPGDLLPMEISPRLRSPIRRIDGIISAQLEDPENSRIFEASRYVPVVLLDEVAEGADVPCVVIDNVGGAREAVGHLLSLGHRRIGHIAGHLHRVGGQERLAGYLEALAEVGIERDDSIIAEGRFGFDHSLEAAEALLSAPKPPTAIFCADDISAIAAMRAAYERGMRVPEDLSLVGFNDLGEAQRCWPALTTMAVDKEEMGRTAFRMLKIMIDSGADGLRVRKMVIPATLTVRDSCRPLGA